MKKSLFQKQIKKAEASALLFSEIQTLLQFSYWYRAINVSRYLTYWNGRLYWTSGGKGRFIPWPKYPGMLAVMTPADYIDDFFYFLITSNLYIPIAVELIVLSGLIGFCLGMIFLDKNRNIN